MYKFSQGNKKCISGRFNFANLIFYEFSRYDLFSRMKRGFQIFSEVLILQIQGNSQNSGFRLSSLKSVWDIIYPEQNPPQIFLNFFVKGKICHKMSLH